MTAPIHKPLHKRALDQAVKQSVKTAAAVTDPMFGRLEGPRILVYHQFDAGLGREMEIPSDVFEQQVDWLQANCEIVDLDTALARRGEPDAHRLVVLTFDDGYDDMYRLAGPILRDRRLPFVVYLTTHPTESGEPLFDGGRAEPISWAQIDALAQTGLMTLGAHTHRHPDMRTVTGIEIARDLDRSNELIQSRMGVVPTHFCYPYGYWSEQAHGEVAARYTTATLGSGPGVTAETDPLLINRVPIQLSDGMIWFKRKLRMGLHLEDRLRRRFKGYDGP